MTKLIACTLLAAVAACSHHDPAPKTTAQLTNNDTAIDPTMPSWAPQSCMAYHTAVVNYGACNDVDQATRDKVAAKYDADNKGWHDITNATQADLDRVKAQCSDAYTALQTEMTGKCKNVDHPAQAH